MKVSRLMVFLLPMLVSCAVTAASASAQPPPIEWISCKFVGKGNGSYFGPLCLVPETGGRFERVKLILPDPVTLKGILIVADMGAKSKISCEETGEGTVGPGSADTLTKFTATKCTESEGSCESSKPITMKAVHLPWNTELFEGSGGEARDRIKNGGSGEPGLVVECTVLGIFKITDECVGVTSSKMTVNEIAEEKTDVTAEFESVSSESPLNCSVGGAKTGLIEGTNLMSGTELAIT